MIATPDQHAVLDSDQQPVEMAVETASYTVEETAKSGYDHDMFKEIHEQPIALRQCFSGRADALAGTITFEEVDEIPNPVRSNPAVELPTTQHSTAR